MTAVIEVMSELIKPNRRTIICGDVNCDPVNSPLAKYMVERGCGQIVTEPTHDKGNTLDHFYVRPVEMVTNYFVHPLYFSDHDAICASVKEEI